MSEDLRAHIAELERKLGIERRPTSHTLEEWTKPDGTPIKVNMDNIKAVEAAKSLGWKRKPGPKPQEPTKEG